MTQRAMTLWSAGNVTAGLFMASYAAWTAFVSGHFVWAAVFAAFFGFLATLASPARSMPPPYTGDDAHAAVRSRTWYHPRRR